MQRHFFHYLTPILLLAALSGYSQKQEILNRNTIIVPSSVIEYISVFYQYRKSLIDSLKKDNKQAVATLKEIKILDTIFKPGKKIIDPILTNREAIMLNFYLGNYDSLLSNIGSRNYFIKSNSIDAGVLALQGGNLTLQFLDFWKQKTDLIIQEINSSALDSETKDFLVTYWKCILLYISSNDKLDTAIQGLIQAFDAKYPNSSFAVFLDKNLKDVKKFYCLNDFGVELNFGGKLLTGPTKVYLGNPLLGSLDIEYEARNWSYILNYTVSSYSVKDSMINIGNGFVTKNSDIEEDAFGMIIGRTIADNQTIRIKALAGLALYRLENLVESSSNKYTLASQGLIYPYAYVGLEGYFSLFQPDHSRTEMSTYSDREEKDKFFNSIYLKFRIGFEPDAYKATTGLNGNIFTGTVAIGVAVGQYKAYYKRQYKKG
jgi:hypothetical protein